MLYLLIAFTWLAVFIGIAKSEEWTVGLRWPIHPCEAGV